jgi:hypothetical protein
MLLFRTDKKKLPFCIIPSKTQAFKEPYLSVYGESIGGRGAIPNSGCPDEASGYSVICSVVKYTQYYAQYCAQYCAQNCAQ